jgi:HlyD family secretion protein
MRVRSRAQFALGGARRLPCRARINRLLKNLFPTRILTSAAKAGTETKPVIAALNNLRKKCLSACSLTAAAKAGAEKKPLIAAVNRCATQNQVQQRFFPQAVKRCATQNQVRRRLFQHSVKPPIPFVLLALGFSLMPGCSADKPEEPTVSVQVVPVKKTTIEQTVTAQAILFPLAQSAIVPKISAPVKAFYVNRGSKVRQGQLLATLENRDLAAAAQENKGGLDQAQAAYQITTAASLPEEIQKAQGDAQAAKLAYEAEQKLYDSRQDLFKQGALPRKDLDQAGVSVTQARNQYELSQRHVDALLAMGKQQELKSAAGQLESAKGKYLGAEAQLGYSEIRSPIAGVVTDRPLYPGEMAAAGSPLLTVMDISSVIARAHIPQAQAALLKVGDKATVAVPGEEDPITGKVTVVSPALDPNSTTVEVWVEARNPKGRLRPGTSVQISMLSRAMPNALVIPGAAVLTAPDGGTYVMVAGADSRAHQTTVKTGIRQGDDVQILDGLKEGDRVIASGAYGLPDKTRIRAEAPQESDQRDRPPAGKETGKEAK